MSPKAFLQQMKSGKAAAGYLFLGNEGFFRDRCRQAIRLAVLGADSGEEGYAEIDLKEQPLARLLDETRSLSLFASSRLIVGRNAEGALPRGRVQPKSDDAAALKAYFHDPVPGVAIVFECTRFDPLERDDRTKIERVQKLFAAVPETVELQRLTASEAARTATAVAKQIGLDIESGLLAELVDMLGADMARIETELQKLALYLAETRRPVTSEDLETLVPEARQSGVYELSDALARRDRQQALQILDTLAKTGAYWQMQISFLASLFRQALAAKELGAATPQRLQAELTKRSVRIWPSRARQLLDVARKFTRDELENALVALYETDRDLRRERPEDRLIVESLVLRLTA